MPTHHSLNKYIFKIGQVFLSISDKQSLNGFTQMTHQQGYWKTTLATMMKMKMIPLF